MSLDAHPLISDWIGVRAGRLLVHTGKVDIGQRISTALARIAHEELTVPFDRIDLAPVRTGHAPDEGITSGSNSIEQSGHAVRKAAATLRAQLIALAVERMGGHPADWQLRDGTLTRPGANRSVPVIDLIGDIDPTLRVDPNAQPTPATTAPAPPMRGIAEMVTGLYTFVQDLHEPGMLHARIIRPPHALARLRSIPGDAIARLDSKGLRLIRDGSFLAVTGADEWAVVKAATALAQACDWDLGSGLPETNVFEKLNSGAALRFPVVDGIPKSETVPEPFPDQTQTARYERPYQMHGALAPSAALAVWKDAQLIVKTHSQGVYPLRQSMAESLGLDLGQIELSHVPGSGCYGHNGADDAAFEAALIAMAIPGTPILLKWTREDEHCREPYAPAMAVDLAAQVSDGIITKYSAEAFSDTHRGRPRPGPNRAGPAKLLANRLRADPIAAPDAQPNMGRHAGMHRNLDPIYGFAGKRLVKNLVSGLPHRTSAMRCLGAAANIYALEGFMDELALGQNANALEFRLAHLTDPRATAVLHDLRRRMEKAPKPRDHGRGIAYAQYKNAMTRVGVCVDLKVTDLAEVRLTRAIIVADAGRIIDRDGLQAQLEGGFIQAASWALHEEVTWDRDGIQSRDWDRYPVLRFDNIPDFEVVLLDQPEEPSVGAGEASPGPAIAAIANAIHDATGLRMRRMPFTADAIMRLAAAG